MVPLQALFAYLEVSPTVLNGTLLLLYAMDYTFLIRCLPWLSVIPLLC